MEWERKSKEEGAERDLNCGYGDSQERGILSSLTV